MRLIWLMLFCLLTACDDLVVKQCEDHIFKKLRSPSTYKRINIEGTDVPYPNPDRHHLRITYDAANAYGTPVREEQVCVFGLKDGKPDTSKYYDFDGDFTGKGRPADDAEKTAEAALKAADDALNNAMAIR